MDKIFTRLYEIAHIFMIVPAMIFGTLDDIDLLLTIVFEGYPKHE